MAAVLRGLVDSVDMAVYSYVKPGAPHRYSVRFRDLRPFIATLTSALRHYMRSIELGVSVATGAMGLVDVNVGSLIRDSIQDNIAFLGRAPLPELHVFLVPACVASSYTLKLKERFTLQTFLSARRSLLIYSKPQEVVKVYEAFRNAGGDLGRALYESGVTSTKISSESLTLEEFLNILGNRYRYIGFTSSRYHAVVEASNEFIKEYERESDWNSAALTSYSVLLNALGSDVKPPLRQRSKDEFKKALELDAELGSRNVDYTPLIPALAESILIGLLSIYPPK
ncbi:MAG: hypothetical protein QXS42_05400 [Zestosphaera sp.]